MNIDLLNSINNEIRNCDNINKKEINCSKFENSLPFIMEPKISQKILLITRDPSNIANNKLSFTGFENTFFTNHILPLIYKNFKHENAKNSIDYFMKFQEHFVNNIYWTHYSKCFPGINKTGNHKEPNSECARRFLIKEINAFSPELIILVGKNVIDDFLIKRGYLEKDAFNNFLKNPKNKFDLKINDITYKYCFTPHPSNVNNRWKKKYNFLDAQENIQNEIFQLIDTPI